MSLNTAVVRNGETLTLTEAKFGKKSKDNFGKVYYTPTIEPPILTEITTDKGETMNVLTNITGLVWFGLKDAADALTRVARGIFQDIYLDNVNETTGLVNEEKMQQDWSQFTAGVEKLKDINALLEVYYDEQQSILADENFGATVDGQLTGAKTEAAVKLESRMLELAALIHPLKVSKAALMAEYADRVAKRAERKAKEEADEKVPATK